MDRSDKVVCWCGMGGNRIHAEKYASMIYQLGGRLKIISEWDENENYVDIVDYVLWDQKTVLDELKSCRIGIAPQDVELQPCKSNVKVSLYMSCGLMVIASPLRAYEEIIVNERNGWIVETEQQWKDTLNVALNCTEEFRINMNRYAAKTVSERHAPDIITDMWLEVLRKIIGKDN